MPVDPVTLDPIKLAHASNRNRTVRQDDGGEGHAASQQSAGRRSRAR
jgi:hypothetical protein